MALAAADVSGEVADADDELIITRDKLAAAVAQIGRLEAKVAEKVELCAEKDAQIAAVLEEGEQLSIRQAEQEKQIRSLRQSTREAQASAEKSATDLTEVRAELARTSKMHSAQAIAAAGQHDSLLAEALGRSSTLEAEANALRLELDAAKAKLTELGEEHTALGLASAAAETREAVALDALREVQLENARLLEAGRWRDEGISHQIGELSARTESAEVRSTLTLILTLTLAVTLTLILTLTLTLTPTLAVTARTESAGIRAAPCPRDHHHPRELHRRHAAESPARRHALGQISPAHTHSAAVAPAAMPSGRRAPRRKPTLTVPPSPPPPAHRPCAGACGAAGVGGGAGDEAAAEAGGLSSVPAARDPAVGSGGRGELARQAECRRGRARCRQGEGDRSHGAAGVGAAARGGARLADRARRGGARPAREGGGSGGERRQRAPRRAARRAERRELTLTA